MIVALPCLPLIQERFYRLVVEKVNPDYRLHDVTMRMFSQVWGSTALGFGGVGGCALTTAHTVVVCDAAHKLYGVFFGDSPAYLVEDPSEVFFEDLRNCSMRSCADAGVYNVICNMGSCCE